MQDESEGARRAARAGARSSWPGLWQAALVAALSGAGLWMWAPQMLAGPLAEAASGQPALASLADADQAAGLATMAGSRAFLAQFRDASAWLRRASGLGERRPVAR